MLSMSLRNFLNTVTAAFGVCVLGDVCVCVCVCILKWIFLLLHAFADIAFPVFSFLNVDVK